MVQYNEGSFLNSRKQDIFTSSYLPSRGPVNGVVFFLHGFGEYSGRSKEGGYQPRGHQPHESIDLFNALVLAVFSTIVSQGQLALYVHDYHGVLASNV